MVAFTSVYNNCVFAGTWCSLLSPCSCYHRMRCPRHVFRVACAHPSRSAVVVSMPPPPAVSPRLIMICMWLLIGANLVGRGLLALLEVIGTPMFIRVHASHDGHEDANATQVTAGRRQ